MSQYFTLDKLPAVAAENPALAARIITERFGPELFVVSLACVALVACWWAVRDRRRRGVVA
jgi:hypothetical protein